MPKSAIPTGSLGLRGEVEITVRDKEGKIKSQTQHRNSLVDEVRAGLIKELIGNGNYSSIVVPTQMICITNKLSPTTRDRIGANRWVSVDGNSVTINFQVYALKSQIGFSGTTTIKTVYLMSDQNTIGTANPNPNPSFDDDDYIDVLYKIILTRNDSDVSDGLVQRLADIIKGVDAGIDGWQPGVRDVIISRATLFDGVTDLTGKIAFSFNRDGNTGRASIRFNEVPSSTPDNITYYINEGAGIFTEAYTQDINMDNTGYTSGDNVIVPFTVSIA